jgi:hypothetical protein
VILWLVACGPAVNGLFPEDPTLTGEDGEDGPFGQEIVDLRASARVSEVLHIEVIAPTRDGVSRGGPAVMFVQGGLVDVERYRWLGLHLASRGYVWIAPSHRDDLAILQSGNSRLAWDAVVDAAGHDGVLDGLIEPDAPVAIGGHSLGGVVATMDWAADDTFGPLFLLASFPAAGTDTSKPAAVLSMVGSADGKADPDDVAAGIDRFGEPSLLGVVDGLNHYGWTDDPSAGELRSDGDATRPVDEARRDALRLFDAWLDANLKADGEAADRLYYPFDGVVTTW